MSAGHASLVGRESGKVIAYGVASSRCIMCERGHSPEDHKCNRNHFGSAKSMEPALAVLMITKNAQLADANCVVSTLIGDEDSCTIQAVRRESEVPVEKWADMNHVLKSFSSALYAIKVILSLRGKGVTSMTLLGLRFLLIFQTDDAVLQYLRSCFSIILHANRDNPRGLKADLGNLPDHAYGNHMSCGAWCRYHVEKENYKHNGLKDGKDLESLEFKASLVSILKR